MKKYPLYNIDYYERFRDMIEGMADKYGDRPAIYWYNRRQEEFGVSYNELRDDVRALQESMISLGLAGKHIAVAGENSYEWLLVYFACTYCGSVAVCIDVEQSDETILQMLEMADVEAAFVADAVADLCASYLGEERKMFLLGKDNAKCRSVRTLVEEGKRIIAEKGNDKERDALVKPDSTAAIVFTSGTTSFSKPVMLSQKAILTNAADASANVKVGEVVFTSLPFYHTYGITCSVLAILDQGSKLYINGNLKTVMRDLHLARPHTLLTVPLMLETIHNKIWATAEESGKADGLRKLLSVKKFLFSLGFTKSGKTLDALREKAMGAVKVIICGGAHLDPELNEEFWYMGINVLQGYGITECAPLVSVNRNDANKRSSVGLVSAHSEVKIEDGEILVRGANVMQGYYKLPELTAEAMRDGWFCTGDEGELDKDGYLYITGRKKNMIVLKNGKKVSPEKLEEKIKKIAIVQDVMVYGVTRGSSADDVQIAASIYPDKEKTEGMNSYDVLEHLQEEINVINNTLPMYQQIQMVTIREQEFSKTSLQKIKRYLS